jgi:hypothetical protein
LGAINTNAKIKETLPLPNQKNELCGNFFIINF